jgi:S1-C subfamily serine protease
VLAALPVLAGGDKHKCDYDAQSCLAKTAESWKDRGWVGIEMDLDEETGIYTVNRVVADSPAYSSGFQIGDVLLSVDGDKLTAKKEKAHDEEKAKAKAKKKKSKSDWVPGRRVTYTVKRNGNEKEIYVTLGSMPKQVLAQWVGNHMLEYHMPVEVAQK